MTRRRLLLHIGSPKCGSTYLQQVLRRNAELLLEHGFGYQHPGEGHPGNAGDLATITAERVETLYDFGVKTAILSHEDLYGLPKRGDALSSLVGPMQLDVQLVVFLRPFSEFVFGDYSQFMKQHFERYLAARNPYDGRSFEAVAQRRFDSLQPAQFLRNWAQRFPQHPIRIARHTEIRPTIESLLPEFYENSAYYERWVVAMRSLLVEKGILTEAEIEAKLADVKARFADKPTGDSR